MLVEDADGRLRFPTAVDECPTADPPKEAAKVPLEGPENTPLDPGEARPVIHWREGDPPIDPGDLRYRDAVVYVRPERRDDRDPDSGLGRPEAAPDPSLDADQHRAKIESQRGRAAEILGTDRWSNSRYAGRLYDNLTPSLRERFPHGVQFSDEGFPMLDRYAVKTVVFEEGFRGPQRQDDFKRANDIFGWARTPRGMVWHHKEDGRTMVLVDRDLHREVAHWGGVRVAKRMNIWEGENR